MRCKWKFLSGASGKTFVFLINTNTLGGQSLLFTPALLPGMQAWCLEITADVYDREMTNMGTKINFLRMVGQKCRKTLGL